MIKLHFCQTRAIIKLLTIFWCWTIRFAGHKIVRELTETYLKDMKSFKLYVATVVSQHVHHQFQVLGSTDVFGHDCKVVSVQQEFSQELCVAWNKMSSIKQFQVFFDGLLQYSKISLKTLHTECPPQLMFKSASDDLSTARFYSQILCVQISMIAKDTSDHLDFRGQSCCNVDNNQQHDSFYR